MNEVRGEMSWPDSIPAPAPPDPLEISKRELAAALLLFSLTGFSTWLTAGPQYSVAVLTILLCHEMGHYLTARRYRVRVSLPLFLPLPVLSPFGTMGAIIKIRQRIRTRRALYDIGIAGPLAGIPPAILACAWGLSRSEVVSRDAMSDGALSLGSSLLFQALENAFFPGLLESQDILLHPVAFAGWAGLFVTGLNLLPIGQLDGGHVLYGLLGKRAVRVAWTFVVALAVAGFFFPGWWFVLLLILITRVRHPETVDESIPLDRKRILLGVFALAFFVVTFIPRPIILP